jgi:hypothetical protein
MLGSYRRGCRDATHCTREVAPYLFARQRITAKTPAMRKGASGELDDPSAPTVTEQESPCTQIPPPAGQVAVGIAVKVRVAVTVRVT